MVSLVHGALTQHVRKHVGPDYRNEIENAATLLLLLVERIVLVQDKKLKNAILIHAPVNISNIKILVMNE